MRVISGLAKGRKLVAVPGTGTRPITDRVKEALFSILAFDLQDTTFLDLFGGTGAVGIEALSRGAASAVFIDMDRRAVDTIRKNLEITRLDKSATVLRNDAFRYVAKAPDNLTFDYVYVAPPQYQGLWAKMLLALNDKPLLSPNGLIIVQIHPKEYHELEIPRLRLIQQRNYGSTVLYFYELAECTPPAEDPHESV